MLAKTYLILLLQNSELIKKYADLQKYSQNKIHKNISTYLYGEVRRLVKAHQH